MGLFDSIRKAQIKKDGIEAGKNYVHHFETEKYRKPKFLNYAPNDFYFGEVVNKKTPTGCGLFHKNDYFIMYENISDLKGNGMTIFNHFSNSGQPFLCMSENGNPAGPILYVEDKKSITLTYILNGSVNGFYFNVTTDGEYVIGRYFSGSEKSTTITFDSENCNLIFQDSSTGQRIDIPVSYNFKYNFHKRMFIEPFPYDRHEVSPARIEQAHSGKNHEYALYGGITSYTGEVNETNNHLSTNEEYGYGLVPLKNKDFYFGAFFNGKFDGTGCYRRASDNVAFMGQFYANHKHGNMVSVYNQYSYELCSYDLDKKDGVSFIIKDNILYIQPYKANTPIDYYFKIMPTMEKIEKYSLNNKLLETFVLPKEKLSNEEVKKLFQKAQKELKEKQQRRENIKEETPVLSRKEEAQLSDYTYEITEDKKVKITGFKKIKENIVNIPSCVHIIGENCFNGSTIHSLNMPNSIVKIEYGALHGIKDLISITLSAGLSIIGAGFCYSTKLRYIKIPKGIKSISTGAFSNCKNLSSVDLYKGTKFTKGSFPSRCKVKIVDLDKKKETPKYKFKKKNIFKRLIEKIKDFKMERQLSSTLGVSSSRKTKSKEKSYTSKASLNININKFSIIQFVILAIVLFYMIAALTGFIVDMQDGLAKIPGWAKTIKITYKFFLVNQSVKLFDLASESGWKIILYLLIALLVALSAIADILVYAILGILLALLVILAYILHLGLLVGVPLAVFVGEIVYYIKEAKDEEDSHLISYLLIGLTSIATIIFYISVIHRAIYKY